MTYALPPTIFLKKKANVEFCKKSNDDLILKASLPFKSISKFHSHSNIPLVDSVENWIGLSQSPLWKKLSRCRSTEKIKSYTGLSNFLSQIYTRTKDTLSVQQPIHILKQIKTVLFSLEEEFKLSRDHPLLDSVSKIALECEKSPIEFYEIMLIKMDLLCQIESAKLSKNSAKEWCLRGDYQLVEKSIQFIQDIQSHNVIFDRKLCKFTHTDQFSSSNINIGHDRVVPEKSLSNKKKKSCIPKSFHNRYIAIEDVNFDEEFFFILKILKRIGKLTSHHVDMTQNSTTNLSPMINHSLRYLLHVESVPKSLALCTRFPQSFKILSEYKRDLSHPLWQELCHDIELDVQQLSPIFFILFLNRLNYALPRIAEGVIDPIYQNQIDFLLQTLEDFHPNDGLLRICKTTISKHSNDTVSTLSNRLNQLFINAQLSLCHFENNTEGSELHRKHQEWIERSTSFIIKVQNLDLVFDSESQSFQKLTDILKVLNKRLDTQHRVHPSTVSERETAIQFLYKNNIVVYPIQITNVKNVLVSLLSKLNVLEFPPSLSCSQDDQLLPIYSPKIQHAAVSYITEHSFNN